MAMPHHEINIHVLKLSRCPRPMLDLMDGDFMLDPLDGAYTHRAHRDAPRIYVHPDHYETVKETVETMNLERWHLIACDLYRERLEKAAKSLPSRLSVKVTTVHTFSVELIPAGGPWQCQVM